MNSNDYNSSGKRIKPFRSIHKNIRRKSNRYVDHTGAHRLNVQPGIISDKTLSKDSLHITVDDKAGS